VFQCWSLDSLPITSIEVFIRALLSKKRFKKRTDKKDSFLAEVFQSLHDKKRGYKAFSKLRSLPAPPMKRFLLVLSALCLIPMHLFAWTNGELLIWMGTDRGHGLEPIAKLSRAISG
jgi:hypothetical protein